jgi:hypothetical protein
VVENCPRSETIANAGYKRTRVFSGSRPSHLLAERLAINLTVRWSRLILERALGQKLINSLIKQEPRRELVFEGKRKAVSVWRLSTPGGLV